MQTWQLILIIVALLIVLLAGWWWYRRTRPPFARRVTMRMQPRAAPRTQTMAAAAPVPQMSVGNEFAANDKLEIIEGIGPEIAGVLKAAGITTLAALAATDVARLEQILRDANLPLANPASWPEQARLAAQGKMAELRQMQDKLKAGQ